MRILVLLAVATGGCSSPEFVSTCSAIGVSNDVEASLAAGRTGDFSSILPGGRAVTPGGRLLDVGGFPISLKVIPGDRYVVVSDDAEDDQALRIVDLEAPDALHPVVSEKAYPLSTGDRRSPGMFYGLAVTKNG